MLLPRLASGYDPLTSVSYIAEIVGANHTQLVF
jgi:hypothetical protein